MLVFSGEQFDEHVEECKTDFKNSVLKRMQLLKIKDLQAFNTVMEQLEKDRNEACIDLEGKTNYAETKCIQHQTNVISNMKKINELIDAIQRKKRTRKYFCALKDYTAQQKLQASSDNKYVDKFYQDGLYRRVLKSWKLFAFGSQKVKAEERLKNRVDLQINTELQAKQNEVEFLECLIKQYEEKYKMELKTRAIVENRFDLNYLQTKLDTNFQTMMEASSQVIHQTTAKETVIPQRLADTFGKTDYADETLARQMSPQQVKTMDHSFGGRT